MGFLFELCFKHLQIGKEENSAKFDYIFGGQRSKLKEENANRR